MRPNAPVSRVLAALVWLALVLAAADRGTPPAEAASSPLRSGTVVEVLDGGVWTYIKARDAQGKEFWVWITQCVVGTGGSVEVVEGAHHERVESKNLGRVLEDCYLAHVLRVGGKEIAGLPAHQIPEGCVVLR